MTDRELMQQALDVLETKERFWAAYRYEAIENIQATITALRERLEQPEQEPVAWANREELGNIKNFDANIYGNGGFDDAVTLYTTPPQRKPLTDEDIEKIAKPFWDGHLGYGYADFDSTEFAKAIETAHGIKP